MLFCDTDQRPPPWFYLIVLIITASVFYMMGPSHGAAASWIAMDRESRKWPEGEPTAKWKFVNVNPE